MRPMDIALVAVIVGVVTVSLVMKQLKKGKEGIQGGREMSPRELEQMTIDRLTAAGSDVSKPHKMEFFLYMPSESNAIAAKSRLVSSGFDVHVSQSEGSSSWLCLATKIMVPDANEIERIREEFDKLAEEFDGEYDGWGAEAAE